MSFGAKENPAPQCAQNPSVRPGLPSRPLPTGSPQPPQNRRCSATSGFAMIAVAGSRNGTTGICTSPAPRCPRAVRADLAVRLDLLDRVEPRPVLTETGGGAWAAGARPHSSQKPSWMLPPHPVREQLVIEPSHGR